jgi:hypothetical protein
MTYLSLRTPLALVLTSGFLFAARGAMLALSCILMGISLAITPQPWKVLLPGTTYISAKLVAVLSLMAK